MAIRGREAARDGSLRRRGPGQVAMAVPAFLAYRGNDKWTWYSPAAPDRVLAVADLFDVLAEPTRRDILGLLRQRSAASVAGGSSDEMSVGELVDSLGITQPTVSKHLKVLRDHGLVHVREDGQHRYYKIASEPLSEVTGWLHTINPTHGPSKPAPSTPPLVDLAPAGYRVGLSLGQLRRQIASLFRR